jgi:hypothetical protein
MSQGQESAATTVSSANAESHETELFLACLPPETPVYNYHDHPDLETLLTGSSFVVVKDFPPLMFRKKDEQLPGCAEYSSSLQLLILKMPTNSHETAARCFETSLMEVASRMGVRRRILQCGATSYYGHDRAKEADVSFKPTRYSHCKWPTVVVEIGWSETRAKLKKEITWWIKHSHGDVRQGITIDIKQGSGNIEIISWAPTTSISPSRVRISSKGRQVLSKAINHIPPPRIDQKIGIKRGKGSEGPTITGGNLTIPFASVLLDNPGEGEGDFVITAEELLQDAELVWMATDIEAEEKARR